MGSLADLSLPTEEVHVPRAGSFSVRGISVADASTIIRAHGKTLDAVYAETVSDTPGKMPNLKKMAQKLMDVAPLAVADIIAQAADDPGQAKKVAKLPVPVQVDALVKVAGLTFESEKQLGELLETVISGSTALERIVTDLTPTLPQLTSRGGSRKGAQT